MFIGRDMQILWGAHEQMALWRIGEKQQMNSIDYDELGTRNSASLSVQLLQYETRAFHDVYQSW